MKADKTSPIEQLEDAQTDRGAIPIRRILVVDDDNSMRHLIAALLSSGGHHVDSAEDGSVAWNILQRRDYDLLVTDSEMPKVSGVDLVKKVRAARMALPVILVSGMMPTEELNRHPWLQLAATLAKPFTGDELLATVDDALRLTSSRGPISSQPPNESIRSSAAGLVL